MNSGHNSSGQFFWSWLGSAARRGLDHVCAVSWCVKWGSQMVSPSCLTTGWLLAEESWLFYTWCLLQKASWGLFTRKGSWGPQSGSAQCHSPHLLLNHITYKPSPISVVRQHIPFPDLEKLRRIVTLFATYHGLHDSTKRLNFLVS